jgi:hypothetical protein
LEAQLATNPENAISRLGLGLALAHLGRKEDAVREGERASAPRVSGGGGVAENPRASNNEDAYIRHQRAAIYLVIGEPEKALDLLQPYSANRYVVSPGRLKIDPDFDSLRANPRFQRLVAAAT